MENYTGLGLGVRMMALEPSEVPVFLELMKEYDENVAFQMIIDGYKKLPFSDILNEGMRP